MILRESKDGKVGSRPGLTGWLSHILTKVGHGRGTGAVMDAGKV